jgi:hypothetical protein
MRDFINTNKEDVKKNRDKYWKKLYALYIDPDKKAIKKFEKLNIKCTADGLFSITRIYKKYGLTEEMVSEYKQCRKVPIFYFPQERGGINTLRRSRFGDRIDYTLFDLKNYFEKGEGFCDLRLKEAYQKPKTREWLEYIKTKDHPFKYLADCYEIKGLFVNDEYEVYDIKKGNEKIIDCYYKNKKDYKLEWDDDYYSNLRDMVIKFNQKK